MNEKRVTIIEVSPRDAFYDISDSIVGKTGDASHMVNKGDGWYSGQFICDTNIMGSRPTLFYLVKLKTIEEDTVNLEVKFDRKTAKKLEKLAKKWNLSQEETLVRILTEITANKSATPRDVTPDELAAFE